MAEHKDRLPVPQRCVPGPVPAGGSRGSRGAHGGLSGRGCEISGRYVDDEAKNLGFTASSESLELLFILILYMELFWEDFLHILQFGIRI